MTIRGGVYRLGPDKDEAFRQFHLLMGGVQPAPLLCPVPNPSPDLTVRELGVTYLADLKHRVGPRTHAVAACYLKSFLSTYGSRPAAGLRKSDVEDAVRGQAGWNVSTVYHVKCRIVAMFNWAVGEELLAASPIKGLKKPAARTRGPEAVPTEEHFRRLVEAAPPYLRNILAALHDTGARPAEVLSVTADQFDPVARVWVLREHKSAAKTGKARVIHLTERVADLCGNLAEKYPTGPLFRTARGKPFPPAYYLARLVRDLRRKLGLPDSVIPYGLRHGFATDALSKGVPDTVVAALLGHTSTQMIHKHYSHVSERSRELKAALGQVR